MSRQEPLTRSSREHFRWMGWYSVGVAEVRPPECCRWVRNIKLTHFTKWLYFSATGDHSSLCWEQQIMILLCSHFSFKVLFMQSFTNHCTFQGFLSSPPRRRSSLRPLAGPHGDQAQRPHRQRHSASLASGSQSQRNGWMSWTLRKQM